MGRLQVLTTDRVPASSSAILPSNVSDTNTFPAESRVIPDNPAPRSGAVMFTTLSRAAFSPTMSKYPNWSVVSDVNHILSFPCS